MSENESEDYHTELSPEALAALQEFYKENTQVQNEECKEDGQLSSMPQEDWQLSQFWYDEETSIRLAKEAIAAAGDTGSIACISCPTLYHKLREIKPSGCRAVILEFDKRFQRFGEDFIEYDYNNPTCLAADLKQAFDIVIADPPFLSDECLTKTAITIRFLTKEKVVLCTGAIMEDLASRLLNSKICGFLPQHKNNLANEFRCYANYQTKYLDKPR